MIRNLYTVQGVDHQAQRIKRLNPEDIVILHSHGVDGKCSDTCYEVILEQKEDN